MAAAPKPGSWLNKQVSEATSAPKSDLGDEAASSAAAVERWIQKFDVKYSRLLDLPLSQIDERRSRQNQAREVAVIDDSVNRYAAALKSGDMFPPVVGFYSSGKVVLIDGNNRDAAHRKVSAQTIRAFVLDPETPSETIHLMTVDANAHHGVTPSLQWRLSQANHLMNIGHSQEAACEATAVSKYQLNDYRRSVTAEQRARALRINDFAGLATITKVKLGALPSDPVFASAARAVIDTDMKSAEVIEFVKRVKAEPSESQMITAVQAVVMERQMEQKARAALGKKSQIKSPKQGLITGLGKIMHAAPGEHLSSSDHGQRAH